MIKMVILLLNFLIRNKTQYPYNDNNKRPINFKDKNSNDQTEKYPIKSSRQNIKNSGKF